MLDLVYIIIIVALIVAVLFLLRTRRGDSSPSADVEPTREREIRGQRDS